MKLNKELALLRQENEGLRELVRKQTTDHYEQISRMRTDPTYWASGVYKFTTPYHDRFFTVEIFSGDIRLIENHKDHNLLLQQVPPNYGETNRHQQDRTGYAGMTPEQQAQWETNKPNSKD